MQPGQGHSVLKSELKTKETDTRSSGSGTNQPTISVSRGETPTVIFSGPTKNGQYLNYFCCIAGKSRIKSANLYSRRSVPRKPSTAMMYETLLNVLTQNLDNFFSLTMRPSAILFIREFVTPPWPMDTFMVRNF